MRYTIAIAVEEALVTIDSVVISMNIVFPLYPDDCPTLMVNTGALTGTELETCDRTMVEHKLQRRLEVSQKNKEEF